MRLEKILSHLYRRRSSSSPAGPSPSPPSSSPRRIIVVSDESPEFDHGILQRFRGEGFDVEFLPFTPKSCQSHPDGDGDGKGTGRVKGDLEKDRKELENLLHQYEDDLEPGERYAVVAYRQPAFLLLSSHHLPNTTANPLPRLCALILYYPSPAAYSHYFTGTSSSSVDISAFPNTGSSCMPPPSTSSTSASLLPIQVHIAGQHDQEKDETRGILDIYNNNHRADQRHRCLIFVYPESQAGFAEMNRTGKYDRISCRLAWSRALDCLRKGLGTVGDLESVWEGYWRNMLLYGKEDGGGRRAVSMLVGEGQRGSGYGWEHNDGGPFVNCVPTMEGGADQISLADFYSTTFLPHGPASQNVRLLSRTVGPDRIVDELLLSFQHTEEIPWLLPRVPPTDREVEVAIVVAASFCGGKIARQNVYWDQASVLVQIGMLDPGLIPRTFKTKGPNLSGEEVVEMMPVVGAEGSRRVFNA